MELVYDQKTIGLGPIPTPHFKGRNLVINKGQIKPKADWRTVDSLNLFCLLFTFHSKQNKSVRSFLGESAMRQSCFRFYLTCSMGYFFHHRRAPKTNFTAKY